MQYNVYVKWRYLPSIRIFYTLVFTGSQEDAAREVQSWLEDGYKAFSAPTNVFN